MQFTTGWLLKVRAAPTKFHAWHHRHPDCDYIVKILCHQIQTVVRLKPLKKSTHNTQLITSHLSIQQKLGLLGNFSRFNQLFHYKMQHKWRYVQEFKWKDGNRTNDDSKDVQLNLTMQEAVSPGAKSKGEVTNSPLSCWQRPLQTKKNHKTENWLLSENWKFNVNNALYCVNQQNHKTWFLQQQQKAKAQNLEKEETLPWWGQRVNWHWR